MEENKDKRSDLQKLLDNAFFFFLILLGLFCVLIILLVV